MINELIFCDFSYIVVIIDFRCDCIPKCLKLQNIKIVIQFIKYLKVTGGNLEAFSLVFK